MISISKTLVKLSPKEFEKWFKSRKTLSSLDWQKEYKKIGGKLEFKRARKESAVD